MEKDEKYYSNLLEEFRLRFNANKVFNSYLNAVKNGLIREDGTCDLFNIVDNFILDNPKICRTIKKGTTFYRARLIDSNHMTKTDGFDVDDMNLTYGYNEGNSRECPLGFGGAGRNNIDGVSYLYVSNRQETACVEIKPVVRSLISVATFKTQKTSNIVDFSLDKQFLREESEYHNVALGILFTYIMAQYTVPVEDSAEYKATQILTDHIRKMGVDGISYKSFYDEFGINYTFFNSGRDRFEFIGSKIVMLQSERRSFLDFNEGKVREVKTMGYARFNKKDSDEMIRDIKMELERQ